MSLARLRERLACTFVDESGDAVASTRHGLVSRACSNKRGEAFELRRGVAPSVACTLCAEGGFGSEAKGEVKLPDILILPPLGDELARDVD